MLNGTIGGKRKREPGQSVGIAQAGWVRPLMNVVVILFFFSFLGKFHSDGQEKGSFKHTNGRMRDEGPLVIALPAPIWYTFLLVA